MMRKKSPYWHNLMGSVFCALLGCLQFSKQESVFPWTQHLHSFLRDILFSHFSPIISCFLFCPGPLPCFGKRIVGQQSENEQPCQPTVGKHGGGSPTFSQSRLNVSLQWPAVQLQLMCAPPCEAFIGSMPHALLTVETHIHTHFHTGLLLWFCLTRLSHSSQTGVPPCCSHCWTEELPLCLLEFKLCCFQRWIFLVTWF